jgi:hypothetical protein
MYKERKSSPASLSPKLEVVVMVNFVECMVRKFVRLDPNPPNQNVLGGVTKRERGKCLARAYLFTGRSRMCFREC